MIVSKTKLKDLEKKSPNKLTSTQLAELAKYFGKKTFPDNNENIGVLFCNTDNYKKAKNSFYFKTIKKEVANKILAIISPIIDDEYLNEKMKGYYLFMINNNNIKMLHKGIKTHKHYGVNKLISGGQTGADIAGLKLALYLKMGYGGTAPKNYMTENGINYDLKKIFCLTEDKTARLDYAARTKANIKNSDATLIFGNINSPGSAQTKQICIKEKKIFWHISNNDFDKVNILKYDMRKWFILNNIKVLNIAGNRASVNKGIERKVFLFLLEVLCNTSFIKMYGDLWFDNYDDITSGAVRLFDLIQNKLKLSGKKTLLNKKHIKQLRNEYDKNYEK